MAEVGFPRAVAFWFYALAFLAGILFYLIWGFTYGSWNLLRPEWIGGYAVTIVLAGVRTGGMLLYRKGRTSPAAGTFPLFVSGSEGLRAGARIFRVPRSRHATGAPRRPR